jgi:hypothetical protein
MKSAITKILDIADRTYYNWKRERRPIIGLLEKYFTNDDLEEYLKTGAISRLEKLDNLDSELLERHIAYELKHKLYLDTQSSFFKWFEHMAGTGVMDKVIQEIREENYTRRDTKQKILDRIKTMELTGFFNKLIAKGRKNVASGYIENNLSELECYVWVKHYDIVKSYGKYF